MKGIKKILSMVLAIVCIIGLFPTAKVEASIVTVNGGYTTRANAYSWGTYKYNKYDNCGIARNRGRFLG